METLHFTGWVERIYPAGEFDQEFVVANYRNDDEKAKMKAIYKIDSSKDFPSALTFKIRTPSKGEEPEVMNNIAVGDKVECSFFITGISGTSSKTGKYYHINNLRILRNGVMLLEKAGDGAEKIAYMKEEYRKQEEMKKAREQANQQHNVSSYDGESIPF